jgi:ribonuclease T2
VQKGGGWMRRGDVAVVSISSALAAIVVAAVAFSLLVLDRKGSSDVFESDTTGSSWLVVTWGPSLCDVEPSVVGCASGHVAGLGPTLLLHGLWPQPDTNLYCGVPKAVADRADHTRGSDMPSVDMNEDVRKSLQSLMSDVPAVTSHEWYKHGTCSGVTPDVYFRDAAALTEQVRKVLDPAFEAAAGSRITQSSVRNLFDSAFGKGAGDRVALSCRNVIAEGNVIYEVELSLPTVLDMVADKTLSLGKLLLRARTMSWGCQGARVP